MPARDQQTIAHPLANPRHDRELETLGQIEQLAGVELFITGLGVGVISLTIG